MIGNDRLAAAEGFDQIISGGHGGLKHVFQFAASG
jgi:hypothetical protein